MCDTLVPNINSRKTTISYNDNVICEWREVVSEQTGGVTYNLPKGLCFSNEYFAFERIKNACNAKLVISLSRMYKSLSSTVEQQRDKIKELEEEICRLRFSPGGEGALEAEEHFYSLTGEKSGI
nr:bZIP domain containing protein [Marseillevirus futianmevirus]